MIDIRLVASNDSFGLCPKGAAENNTALLPPEPSYEVITSGQVVSNSGTCETYKYYKFAG